MKVETTLETWRRTYAAVPFDYGPFRVKRMGRWYCLAVVYGGQGGAQLVGGLTWKRLCRMLRTKRPEVLWGTCAATEREGGQHRAHPRSGAVCEMGGTEFKLEGETYLLAREADILAILKDDVEPSS